MLAKGKVFVTKEQLKQLFAIPEEAEIVAVKTVVQGDVEGFEFLVMSGEETVLTKKGVPMNLMRQHMIQVEKVEIPQPQVHKGMAEIKFTGNGVEIRNFNGNENKEQERPSYMTKEQAQKTAKQLFDDIFDKVKK